MRLARLAPAPASSPRAVLAALVFALGLGLWGCGASLPQLPVVSVSPAAATVQTGGGTQQFTVTVLNSSDTSVVWKVNGMLGGDSTTGTISQTGLYQAPASVPPGAVTVQAVSVANATVAGTATVTLTPAVTIAVTPATASLQANATQQFTATVTNASNTAVTWSVNTVAGGNATVGTISPAGLYTAPATFPGSGTVTIQAASVQDPSATATATVTLVQPVAVAISPTSATVNLGAVQTFQATVTGSTNTAVTWSVNGITGGNATLGTIAANGDFTAPAKLPAPAQETVTATSVADATKSASAQVTLQVPPAEFSLSPAQATLSLGKAASGTSNFQVTVSDGFANSIQFAVSGLPTNVTSSLSPTSLTATGTVTLTLTTASISLAASSVPVTLTATSTDANGNPLVQTATVLLTITGWSGTVATVAGGPGGVGFQDGSGTADELNPTAVVSDGGENLYFADKRGDALRSYGLVNQTVATLIGSPYNYTVPDGEGMAYNASTQTVYIADALKNEILAFPLGGYDITVLAGGTEGYADGTGPAAEFSYPHGMALSPNGATLYVADTDNETIRAVNIASGAVTTLAGQPGVYSDADGVGTQASFCQPTGLDMDPTGTYLYVSDQCGYTIRQIALATATVTTVAGSGQAGQSDGPALSATFASLSGLKVDPHPGANLVYIADGNEIRALLLGSNPTVYTIAGNAAPGQSDGATVQASYYGPQNLAALADNIGPNTTTLLVADSDNGLLRRLDISNPLTATSTATVVATTTTIAGQPSHRGNADGAGTGTGTGYTTPSVAEFDAPEGIVTDGNLAYVADSNNGAIREINLATSQVTTVAGPHQGFADGPAAQAAFYQDAGLYWLPNLNVIYIADTGNGAIRELNLATQTVTTVAGTDAAGYVDGPVADARFNHPYGILASPDGTKLYVADTGNNVIRLVDLTAGTVSTLAGNGGLGSADGIGPAARFAEPNGLAFDATGANIYISDFENHAIRELNLSTLAVTTIVGASHACGYQDGPAASATLCDPAFITTDGRSLFWGDSDEGLLRVLDLSTLQVSTLAGQPALMHMVDGPLTETPGELTGAVRYNGVFGLAVAPNDNFILFTDKTANVVRIIY